MTEEDKEIIAAIRQTSEEEFKKMIEATCKMPILKAGSYIIPQGLRAVVDKNILIVRKDRLKRIKGYRCRDCEYYSKGLNTVKSRWLNDICLARPKKLKEENTQGKKYYYHIVPTGKVCDKFKLKEVDETESR